MDRLEKIRRWQWIIIAVLVGLCLGWSRSTWITRAGSFGETLNNQRRFERGVDPALQGEPKFHVDSVFMFEMPVEDGTSHRFHAVQGTLQDWEPRRGGMIQRPVTFVAAIPYHPNRLDELNTNPSTSSAIKAFSTLKEPTVVDYLDVVSQARGISYRNAWWDSHPYATWLTVSVLFIGGIVPSVINLALYGTIVRPREEKGTSLWAVENPKKAAKPDAAAPDLDALNEMLADIEGGIDQSMPAAAPGLAKPPEPVRILASAPTTPAPATPDSPSKEFGAKKDDFYPTEQKAKKHPAERPSTRH